MGCSKRCQPEGEPEPQPAGASIGIHSLGRGASLQRCTGCREIEQLAWVRTCVPGKLATALAATEIVLQSGYQAGEQATLASQGEEGLPAGGIHTLRIPHRRQPTSRS